MKKDIKKLTADEVIYYSNYKELSALAELNSKVFLLDMDSYYRWNPGVYSPIANKVSGIDSIIRSHTIYPTKLFL